MKKIVVFNSLKCFTDDINTTTPLKQEENVEEEDEAMDIAYDSKESSIVKDEEGKEDLNLVPCTQETDHTGAAGVPNESKEMSLIESDINQSSINPVHSEKSVNSLNKDAVDMEVLGDPEEKSVIINQQNQEDGDIAPCAKEERVLHCIKNGASESSIDSKEISLSETHTNRLGINASLEEDEDNPLKMASIDLDDLEDRKETSTLQNHQDQEDVDANTPVKDIQAIETGAVDSSIESKKLSKIESPGSQSSVVDPVNLEEEGDSPTLKTADMDVSDGFMETFDVKNHEDVDISTPKKDLLALQTGAVDNAIDSNEMFKSEPPPIKQEVDPQEGENDASNMETDVLDISSDPKDASIIESRPHEDGLPAVSLQPQELNANHQSSIEDGSEDSGKFKETSQPEPDAAHSTREVEDGIGMLIIVSI
jgi:hypothetical protein